MAGDCGSSCPVAGGFYSYDPNIGGNIALLAIYALLLPFVLYFGYRYRTTLLSAILTTGLLLDILGFAGRVLLHGARRSQAYFMLSLLGTSLGPTFMTAGVFLILPHVLTVYGEGLSPCSPVLTETVLYGLAAIALVLQIVGIVFAAHESTDATGANIVASGLAVQAAALLGAMVVYFWFILGVKSGQGVPDEKHAAVYLAPRFDRFLRGLETATSLLLVYSIFRVIDMAGGMDGGLFQNETAFMVVNGTAPLLACILLTVFHPGIVYGSSWAETSPRMWRRSSPPPVEHHSFDRHHAYDPNIRRTASSNSPTTTRGSYRPEMPAGSPGLPSNPRPSYQQPSPAFPTPKSTTVTTPKSTTATDKRYSDRSERRQSQSKSMVDSEALW